MSRGSTARELRGELALTHIAVCVTAVASVLSLGGIVLSLVEDVASGRWVSSLGQGLFLAIVSFLIYGGLVYQLARLGHFNRLRQHRRATDDELDRFFHGPRPAAVTILVPSYKEDPLVVRRTLLSAALQDYPWRRVVLLIDDPTHPSQASDIPLLTAARGLAAEIQETLRKPREHFEDALRAFLERSARGPLDPHQEMPRLAQLYRDAATWFEHQGARYSICDHADALFVEITFRIPAQRYHEQANRWARRIAPAEPALTQTLLADHRRLAARFQADLTGFERKRFDNLSHEPNKAMNLNSYISLMGQHRRIVDSCGSVLLEPADAAEADLSVPNPDFVLMVDADSLISPDYSLRLSYVLAQPGSERIAVVQTPYSAFPHAPGALERIAGATTDIQYFIHQGFTSYGATFWVGANALVRKAALDDIAESDTERGHPIRRYIQDHTVIEDTESTVDLISRGWKLYNYPERLAFSATPPDFGSLLIQRRRWANGGLLILPKLVRYLAGRRSWAAAIREGFMQCHYLTSLAVANAGLLLILALSFDDSTRARWLPLTALPYFALYARDLQRSGYRASDVFRVYALNLMLIPVHLGGVFQSLRQAWTGRKSPFGRTPKIKGRTIAPPRYLIAEYAMLMQWLMGAMFEFLHGRLLHGWFALANAAFLAYALLRFIGLQELRDQLPLALRFRRPRFASPKAVSSPAP